MNDGDGDVALLASLLRSCRRAGGLTQRQLASKAGLSVGAVRDLEQGRTRWPQPESLAALANALGLSLEQIASLGGTRPEAGPLIQVLGPLAAWRGNAAVALGTGARQAVLGLLALSAGSLVHREALIDVLWPNDPPGNAVSLVQAHVSRLRRILAPAHLASGQRGGAGLLIAAGPGYQLQASPDQLDLLMLRGLWDDARAACSRGDLEAGCHLFEQATQLWRGEPLANVDLLRGHSEVVRWSRRRAELVTEYARAASGAGWHRPVLGALRELAAREPLNEQAHAQLMIALAGCGQQGEALGVYRELCRRLDDELGMPPSPDLAEAHQRVLRQEIPVARTGQDAITVRAAGTAAAVVPRQLPAGPERFVGREAELSALRRLSPAARGTVAISAVGGMPGIGKTALALHWAHQAAADFPDGQLYVNLRGFDPSVAVPPAQALGWFLEALGVTAEAMPASQEARAALYRSLVAGRRVLVLLDNARDADHARPLLPGSPGCMVLVTSRRQLTGLAAAGGARLLTLDVLNPAEARQMLAARIGARRVAAEPGPASEIAKLCALLPLALAVAAAHAAARPGFSLASLADELRDTATRLDTLDADDPAASVRAVFSWSTRLLSTGAARMFRLLGLHPGPDITASAAASLTATDLKKARQALAELARAHLITEHAHGRYAFHDLLRAYAADQADVAEGQDARRAATGRFLDYYLHSARNAAILISPGRDPITIPAPRPGVVPEPLADRKQAMAWMQAEHQALLAATALAAGSGFDSYAWQLPWAMTDFLRIGLHWQEWAATQRAALTAATRLDDTAAQAVCCHFLAGACFHLGDYGESAELYGRGLTLYQRLGDRFGEAKVRENIGLLAERQGRYADALRHVEQALGLYQAIGDKANEAVALNAVGWTHCRLRDYQQGRAFCRQALNLCAQTGDRWFEGDIWDSLGYAEHHLGNLAEAAACYQRALIIQREAGHRFHESIVLTHLGDTRYAEGKLSQARGTWQEALDILDELHHPDADKVRAKLVAAPRS
jgi:DNA-binding SARP family transcriptional activator/DNA-binding phage protein